MGASNDSMWRTTHRRSFKRRWRGTVVLAGWLAGLHGLPLLHTAAHEIPHQHIGSAISFVINEFGHRRHVHEHGLRHSHHHAEVNAQAAADGATPSTPPQKEAPHRPRTPQTAPHGLGDLAHGVVAVLAPTVDVAVADLIFGLYRPTAGTDDRRIHKPRLVVRARDPPT